MKKGDLVKCSGPCYDVPINHHNAGMALRHYVGFLSDGSLGVIIAEDITHYEFDQQRVWYQVVTGGLTAWVNGSCVRAV